MGRLLHHSLLHQRGQTLSGDYARDIDKHSGGAWKEFSDKRCRNTDRMATLDRDLNVIGK